MQVLAASWGSARPLGGAALLLCYLFRSITVLPSCSQLDPLQTGSGRVFPTRELKSAS